MKVERGAEAPGSVSSLRFIRRGLRIQSVLLEPLEQKCYLEKKC